MSGFDLIKKIKGTRPERAHHCLSSTQGEVDIHSAAEQERKDMS